jgi:hypothetical protein
MILFEDDREVVVQSRALAEDLLLKWGYDTNLDRIPVKLDDVTPELSAWGIPWKYV